MKPVHIAEAPGVSRIIGPTILLGSGTYFDYEAPEASSILIEDVAYAHGYDGRFAGQCYSVLLGRRVFYSVAEHCVRMSYIVPPEHAYDALMHEVGEAVCRDIPGPLKLLCPEFKAIEKRIEAALHKRFGVEMRDPKLIKHYDRVMLATEKRDLMHPNADQDDWSFIAGAEPLPEIIIPWSPDEAVNRFLLRYEELRP